jgi:hypothetical protein
MSKLGPQARDDAQLALASALVKSTRAVIMASRAETLEQAIEAYELFEAAAADFGLAEAIMKEIKENK